MQETQEVWLDPPPLQYSCLENPMDRGQVGHSPWSGKELDTPEQLNKNNNKPLKDTEYGVYGLSQYYFL